MAFKNTVLKFNGFFLPSPSIVWRSGKSPRVQISTLFQSSNLDFLKTFNSTPRIHAGFKNNTPQDYNSLLPKVPYVYNPFSIANPLLPSATVKGMITEMGAPIIGKNILVVLMTLEGNAIDKVYTDLEGNFIFYQIPQNLSLMAVAVDATLKYNAVILSKILTIENGGI